MIPALPRVFSRRSAILKIVEEKALGTRLGYTLVRRDRNKKGGGVCVYLRDSLSFQRLHEFEEQNLELIALEIQKPNSKPFLFTAWYRPPKLDSECFKYFELFLEKVEPKYKEIYLLGDLNCNFFIKSPRVSYFTTNGCID